MSYLEYDRDLKGSFLTAEGHKAALRTTSWEFDGSFEEATEGWVAPEGYEVVKYGCPRTGFAAILPKED